jgi:hypothetical protein
MKPTMDQENNRTKLPKPFVLLGGRVKQSKKMLDQGNNPLFIIRLGKFARAMHRERKIFMPTSLKRFHGAATASEKA